MHLSISVKLRHNSHRPYANLNCYYVILSVTFTRTDEIEATGSNLAVVEVHHGPRVSGTGERCLAGHGCGVSGSRPIDRTVLTTWGPGAG